MESSKHRLAEQSGRPRGLTGEVGRLKTDSAANVAELRDFIGQMHGKNPQEVMGLVAESGLIQSTLVAAAGVFVLLVVFSVGPYLLGGDDEQSGASNAESVAGADDKTDTKPDTDNSKTAAADSASPPGDGQKVLDTLGIGDTKAADPKKNPLDTKLDKLLEGID